MMNLDKTQFRTQIRYLIYSYLDNASDDLCSTDGLLEVIDQAENDMIELVKEECDRRRKRICVF